MHLNCDPHCLYFLDAVCNSESEAGASACLLRTGQPVILYVFFICTNCLWSLPELLYILNDLFSMNVKWLDYLQSLLHCYLFCKYFCFKYIDQNHTLFVLAYCIHVANQQMKQTNIDFTTVFLHYVSLCLVSATRHQAHWGDPDGECVKKKLKNIQPLPCGSLRQTHNRTFNRKSPFILAGNDKKAQLFIALYLLHSSGTDRCR